MRTIKFRIPHFNYEGNFSHFSYWGTIDHKGEFSDGGMFTSPTSSSGTKKGWHEQFTGLLDKNGKEIYEGDILRNEMGRICEIYWHTKSGLWDTTALNSEGRPIHFMERQFSLLEIIGNIHENPKLLK